MPGNIPLVDPGARHAQVPQEVAAGWADVVARTAFVGGPQVAGFAAAYAECVLPANPFIATAEAVASSGATPVLADRDPDTGLLDVDAQAPAGRRGAVA